MHRIVPGIVVGLCYGRKRDETRPGIYSPENEKNASDDATKLTESLATVQAEMATNVNQISVSKPYTEDWFYQPNMVDWTDESVYISDGKISGWLTGQTTTTFYDYLNELWITPYFQPE